METSTKKCRECKAEIPSDAKVCQFCKAKQGNWVSRHKILTSFGVILLIGLVGGMGNTKPNVTNNAIAPENKEIAIKITAIDLYSQYEANEIQADEKFKNKILEVSGNISSIGKDIMDNPYIALKTNNIIGSVQCMLDDAEKAKAAQLEKGARISVEGKNSGKLGNIILRNCQIH